MSRLLRQKHVVREILMDNYELPKADQNFVRIIRCCGNNLHEVESADKKIKNYLVSMPKKYRKNIWIKRGDIVLVEPIEEGKKVKGEICKILTNEIIKEYKRAGIWPERFSTKENCRVPIEENTFLIPNDNRPYEGPKELYDSDSNEDDNNG